MKKMLAIFTLLLLLIPAAGDASFLIRLKNGGQLATPMYWIEGRLIFFYYAGGVAGMERKEIERVEKYEEQAGVFGAQAAGTRELPPSPPLPATGEAPDPGVPADTREEKVNIQAYKDKKDQMTVELDDLLEKMREAAARKDEAAREKAMEEIRAKSGEIYKLTDEVTKKNKGKLPEGWWEK